MVGERPERVALPILVVTIAWACADRSDRFATRGLYERGADRRAAGRRVPPRP